MLGWPQGDGEMAARIRASDWTATPLGTLDNWSPPLCTAVSMMLAMPGPATILWGPSHVQLYNDAYVAIARARHPALLGRPVAQGWPDAYDEVIAPLLATTGSGRASRFTGLAVVLHAPDGGREERIFDTSWSPIRDEAGAVAGTLQTLSEVTEGHRAQASMQAIQRRQAFLLELSDALRPLNDPVSIQQTAMRVLGATMEVNRAFYGDAEDDHDTLVIGPGYSHDTFPLEGQVKFSEFELDMAAWYRAGRTYVIEDAQRDTRFGAKAKAAFEAIEVGAAVGVPLVKEGRVRAIVSLHQSAPRRWTAAEIALLEDTAERTWAAVERARAEAKLGKSEARFRAFVIASSDVIYRMSPDWSEMWQLDGRAFLADTAEPTSGWMTHYIHPDDQPAVGRTIKAAIRTRGLFELEHRVRRADGTLGWTLSRAVPVMDEVGGIVEWLGAAKDATDRRRAQERLRESEERFRQFADASSDALWIRDAATLTMEYVSPAITTIYGIEPEAILGSVDRWIDLVLPADRRTAMGHIEQAQAGEAVVHEFRIRRPSDGTVRWIRNTDFPLLDDQGRVQRVGGIAEDVTEVRQANEVQDVFVAELQHRTRNLIAVVRGLANDTMERTGPTEAFRAAFSDRLSALSRVQGLLSRSEVEPITIGAFLRLELDALGSDARDGRISVSGPNVFLKPSTVQTLALALHELATNARKYGALSHERGYLVVTWRERIEDDEHRLTIEWVETGLERTPERPVSGRGDGGYGRELIEQALPHALGARTSYALSTSGVRCTIDLAVRPGKHEA